jgi:DNA polymerase III delta prime subunit
MEKIELYFQKSDSLHHFLIIRGFIKETTDYLLQSLNNEYGANLQKGNLILRQFDKFLVDDARQIIQIANRKNKLNEKKFFIITFSFFNNETQNALLKMLEEPATGNHFIFVLPSINNILETIKSRAILIEAGHISMQDDLVKNLMKMNFAERNKWINKVVKEIDDGKQNKNILNELHKKIIFKLKQDKKSNFLITKIIELSKNFNRPDISLKQNLEAILYLLP